MTLSSSHETVTQFIAVSVFSKYNKIASSFVLIQLTTGERFLAGHCNQRISPTGKVPVSRFLTQIHYRSWQDKTELR